MTDQNTLQFYESHASRQAELYNSVTSPAVHHFHRAFNSGCTVLDVGCGSGRDVHTLLQLGYEAYGCDVSPSMISEALKVYPELKDRLKSGSFPYNPPSCFDKKGHWQGILCSAVIQHIENKSLFDFLFSLYHQLASGGSLLMSFPVKYPGVTDSRDKKGRLFHLRPAGEIELLLERIGFDVAENWNSDDGLGRCETRWCTVLCVKGWGINS